MPPVKALIMFQIDISRIIDDTRSTTSLALRFLTDVLEFDSEVKITAVRSRDEKSTFVSSEDFNPNLVELSRFFL